MNRTEFAVYHKKAKHIITTETSTAIWPIFFLNITRGCNR